MIEKICIVCGNEGKAIEKCQAFYEELEESKNPNYHGTPCTIEPKNIKDK